MGGVKREPWFVDLSGILDDYEDLFFDDCHVITKGNRIIAEHIYKYIKDDIKEKQERK